MALGSEEDNMLRTCKRLNELMTGREGSTITRLENKTTLTRAESAELREVWEKVTENIARVDR